ncbi:MAG: 2-dehydropantoate 2-reductase [Deltaproteobacteria bacterium]|nr:2-dehydropantoate 2-reductase [Deltaproteobacteria bacterium]
MKIVIVGAGAMGRFLGGMLGRSGNEVIFVEKDPGIVVQDGKSIEACDLTILAVKSYVTASAARGIRHLVTESSPILTLQTGLGNVETLCEILDPENILGGVTYHGSTSLRDSMVRHAGTGRTIIGGIDGEIGERVERVQALLNASDIHTRITDNVMGHIWAKALVYSAVNPLTALLQLKNGQLTEKMESISLAKRLIDEGKQVAQAYGIQLPGEDLYDSLLEVCRKTSENLSPMLQDLLNGRPTEIDALNGAIRTMGEARSLGVITHQTMTELVRLAEKWHKVSEP